MMELEQAELTRPSRIDLVAAEAVEASLELAEHDLMRLRADVVEVVAKAQVLEARLVDERVDPDAATWMMMRFQLFLARLRSEAEAELDAVRAAATREAARIRARGASPSSGFHRAIGAPSSVWFDELADRAVADAERWISWNAVDVPARRPAPNTRHTTVVIRAEPVVAEPADVDPEVVSDHGDVFGDLGALGSPPPSADPATTDGDTEATPFWAEQKPEPWWRRRRPSKATVLQTGALGVVALAACVHFL